MTKAEKFDRLIASPALRRDLRGKTVRAAAYASAGSGVDFGLRIGSTAVLARLLLPEHFGLVMMVTAITAIAEQLRDFGLSAAVVQKKDLTHAEVSSLFWINLAVSALIALALGAFAPMVAGYYHEPRLVPLVWALSSTFLFAGVMAQHQALLTRQLRLGHTSAIRLGASVASTALAIGLAWAECGYWALVWREIARAALIAIGMWCCLPWVPSLPRRATDVRPLLGFGANLTAANLLGSISAAADRLLLGRFVGAAAVGLFRQAHQLMTAPTDQLVSPIYQVAQPSLSLLQNDPARYRTFFRKMLSMVCVLTMPLSLFAAVYAPELIAILLGPGWSDAAPVLAILSLGTFAKQAVGSTVQVLISLGHTQRLLFLSLLHNLAVVLLMTLGVQWGIRGVAIAEVAATYLLIAPRLHYSLSSSPVSIADFFATAARPAIASIAMALVLLGVRGALLVQDTFISLAIGGAAAVVSFHVAWLLLPGGKLECVTLATDIVRAIKRKTSAPHDAFSRAGL